MEFSVRGYETMFLVPCKPWAGETYVPNYQRRGCEVFLCVNEYLLF